MIITKAQLARMDLLVAAQLARRFAILFTDECKDWMPDHTPPEREAWIGAAITYGLQHKIMDAGSLQVFIRCLISRSLPVPLPPALESALLTPGLSEKARIEALYLKLSGESYKLIPL